MKIRHGEVICEGTLDAVRHLDSLLNEASNSKVLHDGSKGKHLMIGDYTTRSAFSRTYGVQFRNAYVKLRLWYDRRNGTARVSASPRHMTMLRASLPGFGQRLWEVAKSGETIRSEGEKVDKVYKSPMGSVARMATSEVGK